MKGLGFIASILKSGARAGLDNRAIQSATRSAPTVTPKISQFQKQFPALSAPIVAALAVGATKEDK